MSWFRKLLPPKIKREGTQQKKAVPEGLWSKCPSCEAVLYFTDLENNLHVCPKCGFHNRLSARQRLLRFRKRRLQPFQFSARRHQFSHCRPTFTRRSHLTGGAAFLL